MSEVLLHDSDGLMLLCIREHCMAGYIRKVVKGRNGRVHTLSYLRLRLAQDLESGYRVGMIPTYIYSVPTREICIW